MSRTFGPDVTMTPDEFRRIVELVGSRFGLTFDPEYRTIVGRRLKERLTALNLRSFTEYHHHLLTHPTSKSEWDEAMELMTTNETYFFREEPQLRAFRDEILPRLASEGKGRRRLAIWSAGCSTGEEAFSIAILVRASRLFEGWDIRVFGSDVSRRCINIARRGVYGKSSFRAPHSYGSYFEPVADGVQVKEEIRNLCHFSQVNLLDDDRVRLLGRLDVVFCRNVIIYFNPAARRRLISAFYERLRGGGLLLLGHSESLLNVSTDFELFHLREDLVYRKPDTAY